MRNDRQVAAVFFGLGFGAMGIGVVMAILKLLGVNVTAGLELVVGGALLMLLASRFAKRSAQ